MGRFSPKPCLRCGTTIYEPTSANTRYCSLACKRGVNTCEECGDEFAPNKNTAKRFCSPSCFYDNQVPVGSVREFGGGYTITKVPFGTDGSKCSGNRSRWMLTHRYVMQQKLGRPLTRTEQVHHINGKRDDNRPENLELWKRSHPMGVRAADYHCAGCQCGQHGYEPGIFMAA